MNRFDRFSVTLFGELEKYNETISKARCRIFYKGLNRNGSYITDDFAEKLLSTISYAPIKGIYNGNDYEDHGSKNEEGRIYGIVPENPNASWETFLDEDGVSRTYACVDVYIFTALYKEAAEILGKSQSMEIYQPSIRGDWVFMSGQRVFKFSDGCFLGLQVLGDDVEPCFEGAAFFTLYDNITAAFEKIENFNSLKNTDTMGGNIKMNFKISYSQIEQGLWTLLNNKYNEENGWEITFSICELYDNYALVRNFETGTFERVYYTKNEDTDEISITNSETCYIVDVTESEYNTLKAIQALNNNSFEALDTQITELKDENASLKTDYAAAQQTILENEQKIEEMSTDISTLTIERDNFSQQNSEAGEIIVSLQGQVDVLIEYKAATELKEKQAVIAKYAEKLGEEVITEYTNRIADFSAIDLDKELAFALVQTDPTIFSANSEEGLIPKNNQAKTGIEAILQQYRNLKNNK